MVSIPMIPDEILISNLVAHGQPRRHAETLRQSPQLRFLATRFYFDCADADAGDRAAKERVDYFRDWQERLKKAEAEGLGENPDRIEPVRAGPSRPRIHLPGGRQ